MNDRQYALLTVIFDTVIKQLDQAGGDAARLLIPQQTFLLVYQAQGIIDNGGFQYFFEADFPYTPPYSLFVDAFQRIGANKAADALEEAVALFPFTDPHLHREQRNIFMNRLHSEGDTTFDDLDCICGNEQNYDLLYTYVKKRRFTFDVGNL